MALAFSGFGKGLEAGSQEPRLSNLRGLNFEVARGQKRDRPRV
jgi:hypothetical protein